MGPDEIERIVDRVYTRIMSAIEKAKQAGTLHAIDRSNQYTRADNAELLRAVNEAWAKIRICEQSIRAKDTQITELHQKLKNYKWKNAALTSILTALAWEGVKALAPLIVGFLSR